MPASRVVACIARSEYERGNSCPGSDVYVGNTSIDWLETEIPLADLTEFGSWAPISPSPLRTPSSR